MSRPIVTYHESGRFADRYFYQLEVPLRDGVIADLTRKGSISRVPTDRDWESLFYAEIVAGGTKLYACARDPTHLTGSRPEGLKVDLFGGARSRGFVAQIGAECMMVDSQLRRSIAGSILKGFEFAPVEIVENQSDTKDASIWAISSPNCKCVREAVSRMPADNRCFKCGWGPVVCPACKNVARYCPKCETLLIVPGGETAKDSDPRFRVEYWPEQGGIIEGALWDGSDFIAHPYGSIVTGRAVRWFVMVGAMPFTATPCRINIEGVNQQQLERLMGAADVRGISPR